MNTRHKIIIGDSRAMPELEDGSVQLVVTSPPYWQLKDYGIDAQLGFHDSYEEYVNNLNLVWSECCRVLADGCRLCINIGDQFARSVYYGRYKVIPIRTEIIRFCETLGLDYMGAIIWQKVTTTNTTGGGAVMGSYPYPRNGIIKIDYEFILVFKNGGQAPKIPKAAKEASRLTPEEWNTYFAGHWSFPGERQGGHLAMFPEELPARLIKMFSFVGEAVLDPFLGSGTTALAAKNLQRNSVGYEINPDFVPLIRDKVGGGQPGLFQQHHLDLRHREAGEIDWNARRRQLPYQFRDPVRFDKKIDPRTLRFGSRVDAEDTKRDDLRRLSKVLAPDRVLLDSGLEVELIGVEPIPEQREPAMQFLRDATRGQRVFMKYDQEKHTDDGAVRAYLYLENRTFLNAHLIKRGLAEVDTRSDYAHKERFLRSAERQGRVQQ